MFDIEGKIVLITGAADGIGASVVRQLMQENVKHVTILDISDNGFIIEEELNTKYGINKVKFIKCDITQEQELLNAFKKVKNDQGYIDVIVNNAGIGNESNYMKEIEVNLSALVNITVQAWDFMRKDKGGFGGTIINVSSITALTSFCYAPVYSATKSAVLKFGTLLGDKVHYSRTGVRILTLCFGVTITQIMAEKNLNSFDLVIKESILTSFKPFKTQSAEEAAQGLVEAYKTGESGSVWIVTSGKPPVDVTERYLQSTQLYNDIIYD